MLVHVTSASGTIVRTVALDIDRAQVAYRGQGKSGPYFYADKKLELG